ncbi:MAG: hypothetical protein R3B84_09895 [Zavarzinella sp.]
MNDRYQLSCWLAITLVVPLLSGCRSTWEKGYCKNCQPIDATVVQVEKCPQSGCYHVKSTSEVPPLHTMPTTTIEAKPATPATVAPKAEPAPKPAPLPKIAPEVAVPKVDPIRPGVAFISNMPQVGMMSANSEKKMKDMPVVHPVQAPEFVKTSTETAPYSMPTTHLYSNDYSSITGTALYSHVRKNWQLRFASVDQIADFGGSVTLLLGHHDFDRKMDGKTITVRGKLLQSDPGIIAPKYHVEKVLKN